MPISRSKEIIQEVCNKLKLEADIEIDARSMKKLSVQGFNSEVYTAKADSDLIIHILNQNQEQIKQSINKKLVSISNLLKTFPGIPSAEFFYEGKLEDGRFLFAQEKLLGDNLGRRKIENGKIIDEFYPMENKKYFEQLDRILADLHGIKFSKYGWLAGEKGGLDGTYNSWEDFIFIESALWIRNIFDNRNNGYVILKSTLSEVKKKIESLYSRKLHLFESKVPSFVHGDMINPGNILINNGKISGIIDFEWALAGDAAWEFAYSGNPAINNYFDFCDKAGIVCDRTLFSEKMKFYKIIWLLWAVNVHAKGATLKEILFKELVKNIKSLNLWEARKQ